MANPYRTPPPTTPRASWWRRTAARLPASWWLGRWGRGGTWCSADAEGEAWAPCGVGCRGLVHSCQAGSPRCSWARQDHGPVLDLSPPPRPPYRPLGPLALWLGCGLGDALVAALDVATGRAGLAVWPAVAAVVTVALVWWVRGRRGR